VQPFFFIMVCHRVRDLLVGHFHCLSRCHRHTNKTQLSYEGRVFKDLC
jgi:hypothetical protein